MAAAQTHIRTAAAKLTDVGGLANGQTYYYAYYDTLEISFTLDFGGGFPFG